MWKIICQNKIDEFHVYQKLGETDHTFAIYGWIRAENLHQVHNILLKAAGNKVFMSILKVPPALKDKIPVAMENPKILEPFEDLVKIRSTPKYSDIDPSILIAFFMPLFFGVMVGDIGYGFLLFIVSIILSRHMKKGIFWDLFKTLMYGSIWSIVFGFLNGEFFGAQGAAAIGLKALWIEREKAGNLMTLLYIALGIGAAHITLGLIIGAWNAFVHKSKNRMLENIGMLIGLIGIFLMVGELTHILPIGMTTPGIVILIVGLAILAFSMGKVGFFLGPIEFIGTIGNIFSYIRIAALGLASVLLAKVANEMSSMFGSVVIGVIIAALIHAINIVLGAFSPTIQSLRLQYVEFFRKFYEGGSTPFVPFRKIKISENRK